MQNHFLVAITNSEKKERDLREILCQKMSYRSRSFFSELVNDTKKRFCMMVNKGLSRGLGNIAKVYLMRCGQTTCAELKKFEFCAVGHGGIAHIYYIGTEYTK